MGYLAIFVNVLKYIDTRFGFKRVVYLIFVENIVFILAFLYTRFLVRYNLLNKINIIYLKPNTFYVSYRYDDNINT